MSLSADDDYNADVRVALGAAWLDEHEPGWIDRIVLQLLDLSSPCRCILGQVFVGTPPLGNGYFIGCSRLAPGDTPDDLGFDVFSDRGADASREYRALQAEWERVIAARRGPP